MRFYDIALYLFIFNLVLGIIPSIMSLDASVSSLSGPFNQSQVEAGISATHSRVVQEYTPVWSEVNWLVENVRMVIQGIIIVVDTFFKATVAFPVMLNTLICNVPGACPVGIHPLAVMMGGIFLLIYLIGILQLVLGRSTKEMD